MARRRTAEERALAHLDKAWTILTDKSRTHVALGTIEEGISMLAAITEGLTTKTDMDGGA